MLAVGRGISVDESKAEALKFEWNRGPSHASWILWGKSMPSPTIKSIGFRQLTLVAHGSTSYLE